VSQTEEAKTNPESTTEQVERVRKVFVRDLSLQQKVHTVFRVAKKSRHLARSGKAFLALSLVDKTGEIPGRIFDNVEIAEAAFEENDYLLLKGTVIHFRGKLQLVIEQLERLSPEPMDESEFTLPPPPAVAEKNALPPKNKPQKNKTGKNQNAAALSLFQALDMLYCAIETFIQERIEQRIASLSASASSALSAHSPSSSPSAPSFGKPLPPPKTESKPEPKTETLPARGLPKEFAFKPFDVLTSEENTSPTPSEEMSPPSETQEGKSSN